MRTAILLLALTLAAPLPACGSRPPADDSPMIRDAGGADVAAIEAMLGELYLAFGFDAGEAPDWKRMRSLFADGAAFVAPITPGSPGSTPVAVGAETFLADFARYVESPAVAGTGLHERILHARIEFFGTIAHAWVAFEGFVPGEEAARTRGLDSLQLVRDGAAWKLVSFTTQYESPGQSLPGRFLAGS